MRLPTESRMDIASVVLHPSLASRLFAVSTAPPNSSIKKNLEPDYVSAKAALDKNGFL